MQPYTLTALCSFLEDSGYASGDAHPVSTNLVEKQAAFGLLNGPNSESTSDLVKSFPFFTLGRLYSKPASSKNRPTITDFIAAVSLADFSLWAIFDAWDGDWIEAEEGNEMNRIGEDRHETPLKIPAEKTLAGPVNISNPHLTVEGDRKANTLKFSFTITERLIIILHS